MKKKADWQSDLFAYIEEVYNKPFEWAKWDCCKFSDACIKVMTGKSLIPKTLKWKDEESAMKAIKEYGGTLGKAIDKAAKAQNLKNVTPVFMQCGDLVIWKEESEMCGIYNGINILCPSDDGLAVKPTELALRGWRIDG